MAQVVIFDIDGTLIDSVDFHAAAWQAALAKFGHFVAYETVRGQIGKGGDQLLPLFLSLDQQNQYGEDLQAWRADLFKSKYLPLVRPFSAVPEFLRRLRERDILVAVATSAKNDEAEKYLSLAGVTNLVEVIVTSDDAAQSKPAADIFEAVLKRLNIAAQGAVAIGDTPYDAEAAGKAGIRSIGVLCGGYKEEELRQAGCFACYYGPAELSCRFDEFIEAIQ
jgi:HAD superfamily hydrolase (TIGR01509 family)